MRVHVDAAGEDVGAGGVDDLGAVSGQLHADGDDPTAVHEDVGAELALGVDHCPACDDRLHLWASLSIALSLR